MPDRNAPETSHAAYRRKTDAVTATLRRNGAARPHLDALLAAVQEETGMGHDETFAFLARWFARNLG